MSLHGLALKLTGGCGRWFVVLTMQLTKVGPRDVKCISQNHSVGTDSNQGLHDSAWCCMNNIMSPCSAAAGPVSGPSKRVATLKGRNKQAPTVLDEPQSSLVETQRHRHHTLAENSRSDILI